jgi:hypothetical protein
VLHSSVVCRIAAPQEQNAHHLILKKLGLPGAERLDLSVWKTNIADRWDSLKEPVKITLIGAWFGASAGRSLACAMAGPCWPCTSDLAWPASPQALPTATCQGAQQPVPVLPGRGAHASAASGG